MTKVLLRFLLSVFCFLLCIAIYEVCVGKRCYGVVEKDGVPKCDENRLLLLSVREWDDEKGEYQRNWDLGYYRPDLEIFVGEGRGCERDYPINSVYSWAIIPHPKKTLHFD